MYVECRGGNINWSIASDVTFLLKVVKQRTSAEGEVPARNDAILYCTHSESGLKCARPV